VFHRDGYGTILDEGIDHEFLESIHLGDRPEDTSERDVRGANRDGSVSVFNHFLRCSRRNEQESDQEPRREPMTE
jgi:hypothetical protein